MKQKITIIIVAVLLILYDRIEFLYYAFNNPDQLIGFPFKNITIRKDSYIWQASVMFMQFLTALIIHLLMGWKETKWFVIASALVFIEYFLTYGQPFFKILLPGGFYIPGSASTLRMISVCYILYGAIKRFFT